MAEPLSSTRKASPVPSFDSIWDLLNQKGWGVGPSTVCVTSLAGPGDDSAHSRQRGPGVECATRDRLRVGERTQQSNHRGVFCFYAENRNSRGQDSQASPARGTSSIPGLGTDPKAHMVCCMAKKSKPNNTGKWSLKKESGISLDGIWAVLKSGRWNQMA